MPVFSSGMSSVFGGEIQTLTFDTEVSSYKLISSNDVPAWKSNISTLTMIFILMSSGELCQDSTRTSLSLYFKFTLHIQGVSL